MRCQKQLNLIFMAAVNMHKLLSFDVKITFLGINGLLIFKYILNSQQTSNTGEGRKASLIVININLLIL